MVFVPPETETPGTRPLCLSPAPPGPPCVELRVRGGASALLPVPANPAPVLDPADELPVALPCVIPEPLPVLPTPLEFPAGDNANIAASGLEGWPGFSPGLGETITPA